MSVDGVDGSQNDGPQPLSVAASGAEQLTQGLVRSVMNSEPFGWLVDRVEENRLTLRQLIRNLYHLEQQVADVETKQQTNEKRVRELEQQLQSERGRSAALEDRVEELERQTKGLTDIFSNRLIERQRAHVEAQQRDPSEVVELGEIQELVVQDTLLDERPPKVQGRIDGLVVFVELDDPTSDIAEGDVIEAQITDHRDTCAQARLHAEVDT